MDEQNQNQISIPKMEIIETKPINELVTSAIVKVCWVSDLQPNANKTIISEAMGREIASTLPGAPIVGFYDKATEDFEEHSRVIKFKDSEIIFEDITKPYGFVSPVGKPWFENIIDSDGVKRKWLLCEAFLWTRQYKEATKIIGKGQSLELDPSNINGYYEGDIFIFTTATLDKLCILGNEFPPCFDGAGFFGQFKKQFLLMAEDLESIIERRYTNKMKKTIEKQSVSLNYALTLGWGLSDAVYAQLRDRGMADYDVEGIYFESGVIFTVVRDRATTELNRINLIIYNDQSIELESTMVAVEQNWVPIKPTEETPTKPLAGDAIPNEEMEIPMNVSAVYTEDKENIELVEPEVAAEVAAEVVAEVAVEAVAEAEVIVEAEVAVEAEVNAFSKENAELKAENEALKQRIIEFNQKETDQAKNLLIAEYTELVSGNEAAEAAMLTIKEAIIDPMVTLEDAESKLALEYAKIAKSSKKEKTTEPKIDLTFNLHSGESRIDLPDFMTKALEYDEQNKLNF